MSQPLWRITYSDGTTGCKYDDTAELAIAKLARTRVGKGKAVVSVDMTLDGVYTDWVRVKP